MVYLVISPPPPHAGDKLRRWKSNNLQQKLRNRGDLTIPFRSIRRSGDELSRFSPASRPGYHPPTGWQTHPPRVIEKTDHLPCFSLGFDSGWGRIQYISNLANRDEGAIELNQNQLAGRPNWIRKSHFMYTNTFSWTDEMCLGYFVSFVAISNCINPPACSVFFFTGEEPTLPRHDTGPPYAPWYLELESWQICRFRMSETWELFSHGNRVNGHQSP